MLRSLRRKLPRRKPERPIEEQLTAPPRERPALSVEVELGPVDGLPDRQLPDVRPFGRGLRQIGLDLCFVELLDTFRKRRACVT